MNTINKILSFVYSFVIFVIVVCLLFLKFETECIIALFLLGAICLTCLIIIIKDYDNI